MAIHCEVRNGVGVVSCDRASLDPEGGGPATCADFDALFQGVPEVAKIEFRLAIEVRDGIGVLTPSSELTGGNCDLCRQQLSAWLAAVPEVKHVVLDCAAVDQIDESGVSLLVWLLKRLAPRGGQLVLARMHRSLGQVLQLCRLHTLFRTSESVAAALQVAATEPPPWPPPKPT